MDLEIKEFTKVKNGKKINEFSLLQLRFLHVSTPEVGLSSLRRVTDKWYLEVFAEAVLPQVIFY
jgi:hypothetical protein